MTSNTACWCCAPVIPRAAFWVRRCSIRWVKAGSRLIVQAANRQDASIRSHWSCCNSKDTALQGCAAKTGTSLPHPARRRSISSLPYATTQRVKLVQSGRADLPPRIGGYPIRRMSRVVMKRSARLSERPMSNWRGASSYSRVCRSNQWTSSRLKKSLPKSDVYRIDFNNSVGARFIAPLFGFMKSSGLDESRTYDAEETTR